jgi:hypothetical protein
MRIKKKSIVRVKEDEMGTVCSTKGEKKNTHRILVGKPEGKRSVGRTRRRWVENIKMNLRKIGLGDMNWIDMAQDKNKWRGFVNMIMNVRVP